MKTQNFEYLFKKGRNRILTCNLVCAEVLKGADLVKVLKIFNFFFVFNHSKNPKQCSAKDKNAIREP